jgi:hypothetical protein
MLEKNKNADQENVDHKVIGILGHFEKLSTISDSRKEIFYNSPLYFLKN